MTTSTRHEANEVFNTINSWISGTIEDYQLEKSLIGPSIFQIMKRNLEENTTAGIERPITEMLLGVNVPMGYCGGMGGGGIRPWSPMGSLNPNLRSTPDNQTVYQYNVPDAATEINRASNLLDNLFPRLILVVDGDPLLSEEEKATLENRMMDFMSAERENLKTLKEKINKVCSYTHIGTFGEPARY